ncbi:hypothetical protein UFOVP166_13 [uncultured Caudovirales phage]|uniref:Scaffolding protein n=1 Tax=uncultured Caudovirales phage TaxID=2100421 RepID=A0A6J7WGP6_9CAUD|nr:hypothetical protein UFOVP166_13 [uncultured Caudovirales phage]
MSEGTEDIEDLKTAVEALSAKNRELLGELKAAKAKAKGVEIDPVEHEQLRTQVEDLTGKLTKAEKAAAKQFEDLTKVVSTKDAALQSYLIDNGLSDAMLKAGVRPEMMPAVKAMLKSQATIKDEGGNIAAFMGDQPLTDAVSAWAASDEGKHFVSAPANTGGGAAGGNGNGNGGNTNKGNFGGSKAERGAAIKSMFPELPTA